MPIARLLSHLTLQPLGNNCFESQKGNLKWRRIFGGLVIAQALEAAQNTIDDERFVHSLHAYFMRPGNPNEAVIYEVENLRDGKSFATRQVKAIQSQGVLLTMTASFHKDEAGLNYQRPMEKNSMGQKIKSPEELAAIDHDDPHFLQSLPEYMQKYWALHRPFLIRPLDIDNYIKRDKIINQQACWFKLDGALIQNRKLNAVILAYLTDITILDSSLLVHNRSVFSDDIQVASLDHAIWFHRPVNFDDWLLYDVENHNSNGARGLSNGFIYNRQGDLIATIMQEGLMRQTKQRKLFIK